MYFLINLYLEYLDERNGDHMKCEKIKLIEGRDDVTLTTYVLDDSSELNNGEKRPAVIVAPGGAYLCCSDREAEPVALAFLRMGYNAFVLRYSVAYDGSKPYWETDFGTQAINPDKMYPTQMREIGLAFKCIADHAEEWLIDTSKIAICGFSAGAHNCAMYSTHWSKPVIADYVGIDKELLKPAACILGYPLTDYIYMNNKVKESPEGAEFFAVSNRLTLGENWDDEKLLLDMSPARLVDNDTPPTFIWSTAADGLVPVEHSIIYANALAEKKIPFEIHIYENGDHGMSLCDQSTANRESYDVLTDPCAKTWITHCEEWLYKRFKLYK